jgi:sphingomyelin phosphodiesterase acid-like 3
MLVFTKRATLVTAALIVSAALPLATASIASAQGPSGTFALISDIHFDPFTPEEIAPKLAAAKPNAWPAILATIQDQQMSPFGKDTNHALFASTLEAFAETAADVDFALVPGDFIVHNFQHRAAQALSVSETSDEARAMAVKTTIYVADALAKALPNKPIIVALGNEDSSCGDYSVEPGGSYLAQTKDTVRRLAGEDLVEPDFDDTYAAGGYYAVRHPTVPQTLILVVNDILLSQKYRDACGTDGQAAAEAMMTWLDNRLAQQRLTGGKVWLVHHLPWGIDPFATVNNKADTCPAKTVPLLKEPYATRFPALVKQYADIVQGVLSAHIHHDSYRLLYDGSQPIAVDKVAPAVSPVYGQSPSFLTFTYDTASGAPTDYSVTYLSNLAETSSSDAAATWQSEYTFTQAYKQPTYSAETVAALWDAMQSDGPQRDTFRRYYPVSHGELDTKTLPAYLCAIRHIDESGFASCYCSE